MDDLVHAELALSVPSLSEDGVLWDILDEHLAEAAYGGSAFDRGLCSSTRTLRDLSRHPERALLAHVDALVLGGEPVKARLLVPALESAGDDPEAALAAAFALMEAGAFDALLPFLGDASPAPHAAITRAASLTSHPAFVPWLRELATSATPSVTRATLLALGASKGLLVHPVLDALQSDDAVLVAAAARAVRFGEATRYLPIVEFLLDHGPDDVRDALLVTSLAWGSRRALRYLAADAAPLSKEKAALCAALGTTDAQQALVTWLRNPETRTTALFALGFAGNAALAPALYPFLRDEDPRNARTTAQSLGLLFGFVATDDAFAVEQAEMAPASERDEAALPSLQDDDLSADLTPAPEDDLPLPNPAAIEAFCGPRQKLLEGSRCLFGAPASPQQLARVMANEATRSHGILAEVLFVRTLGKHAVHTRGRTSLQLAQLAPLLA